MRQPEARDRRSRQGRPVPAPPGRDWRVVVRPGTAPPLPRASAEDSFWRVTGTVSSEQDAPWLTRAAGTGVASALLWALVVLALLRTGGLELLVGLTILILLPLVPFLVIVLVMLSLVPARMRGASGAMAAPVGRLLASGAHGRGTMRLPAGRLVTVTLPDGRHEELAIASSHRFPVGHQVRAWGPRLGGRRQVWVVRRAGFRGVTLARGAGRLVLVLAACAPVLAVLLLGGVLAVVGP